MRKPIIRTGDLVMIVDPRHVLRVGYPMTPKDLLPEMKQFTPQVQLLLGQVLGRHWRGPAPEQILWQMAVAKCEAERFGGRERSVHLSEPVPEFMGTLHQVLRLRSVQTGTYCPGGGGREDYDPPSLDNRVTRRLALVTSEGAREYPVEHLAKMAPCGTCQLKGRVAEETRMVNPFSSGCCYFCGSRFETDPEGP